jgi:predicted hotdog family 3-hydroxylacyl-ACP dehydratase
MSPHPPIRDLIPHGDGIRQLDRLIDWKPGRAECTMRVEASSRLVEEGRLESVLLLEAMAQSVAACLGHEAYLGGEGVRIGMIVACRELVVRVPFVPVGTALRLVAQRVRGNDATSHFDCEVRFEAGEAGEGGLVATATLTLVHDRPR